MHNSRLYRVEALVLKSRDHGESDRLLTLYTPQSGKLRAIAKGVRKTKSRMSGHLDLFTRSNLLVARGRQLDIITQAEALENFVEMRTDLWRSTYAHYVAELIDGFTVEQLVNYPLYVLAVTTLRRLASSESVEMAVRAFELQLLGLVGFRPQLFRCLECGQEIGQIENRFSPKLGGVLCPTCGTADRAAAPISVTALKVIRNLQINEAAMLAVGDVGDSVRREVEKKLQDYIMYQLEERPRSIRFLERLRSENNALEKVTGH